MTSKGPQLKPGALVYRVIDVDPHDDGPHTWEVGTATVRACSDRQITLTGAHRIRLIGQRFRPTAVGSVFFTTEEDAVLHFLRKTREGVDTATRAIADAQRAIAWITTKYPDLDDVKYRRDQGAST